MSNDNPAPSTARGTETTDGAGTAHSPARLIVAVAVLVAVGVAFIFLPLKPWVNALQEFVKQAGWWGPLIYVGAYVVCTVLLIPASLLTLVAGGIFGFWLGFILTVIGSNLGADAAFLLGRGVMRHRVEEWAKKAPRFAAINEAIGRSGFKLVFLLRLSPVFPFTLLNYLLGLTRVTLPRYAAASLLGMLPGTAVFVYVGTVAAEAAGAGDTSRYRLAMQIGGLVATILATVYITYIAKKALKEVKQ